MKEVYLNLSLAHDFQDHSRGPARVLLDSINGVLLFRDSKTFLGLAFDLPKFPTDLLFFYTHTARSLNYYQSNGMVEKSAEADSVKRLLLLSGPQKILAAPDSLRCRDFFIIFDLLLANHLLVHREQLDVPWIYEVLSRAIPNDERMEHILSHPNDFEFTPEDEIEWE